MFWKPKKDDIIEINYGEKTPINIKLFLPIFVSIIVVALVIVFFLFYTISNNTLEKYLIELKGSDEITIYLGEDYLEPRYIAYNNKNEDVTDKVRVINTINKNQIGTYEIAYVLGNEIQKRIVNVIPEEENYTTIHLKGNKIEYVELGKEYNDPGYVAINTEKWNVTSLVTVTGKVNTNKLYQLFYNIVNTNSIVTTVSRLVIVTKTSVNITLNNNEYTNQNGIKYYQMNNQNYYQNVFTIREKLHDINIRIYDNTNNFKDIKCTIKVSS